MADKQERSPHASADHVAVQPGLPTMAAWQSAVADLVRAAQHGDTAAFERLYQMFAPMVHGLLVSRLPLDEVDDIMQDVFFTAFRQLATVREPAAFGGWLGAITRQQAADFFRRFHRTETLEAASARTTGRSGQLDTKLDAQTILGHIRHLPETYAETLTLRLVEGMTGPEIAAVTGLTPDSVRVNLHRGLRLLRERLGIDGNYNGKTDGV